MKREEAIRELKIFSGTTKTRLSANFWKALEMAIKALEQEPCEDAVSKENLLKMYEDRFIELQKAHRKDTQLGVNWCINTLKDMPSVKPVAYIATVKFSKEDMQELIDEKMKDIMVERKKGKWIPRKAKYDNAVPVYECSICHKNNGFDDDNFCPNCGAEMENGE